ncbi:MAG: sulfate ABC transporter substrate-binding protein [Nitrosospira sp.]|nr:sulfate ABC transporter substrate-binding protein [Nitrosospira sp.]
MRSYRSRLILAILVILLSLGAAVAALHSISYTSRPDPAWEMYEDFNKAFGRHWKARSGVAITVEKAHSTVGVPIHAVIDGLEVVMLALSYDVDALKKSSKFTLPGWRASASVPQNSPYTSTIVFLVRKGNPKEVGDWNDLVRPDVEVITPNPKTSVEARWSYLAAWGYAFKQHGGSETSALEFVKKLFANVKALDAGTHNFLSTFAERGMGDVLLAWENEAHLAVRELGEDKFEIVTPSISILAEPTVSVVDNVLEQNGARDVAKAYIDYLYTTKAQDIAGRHYYRPRDEKMAVKYARQFPSLNLFTIDEVFGSWKEAQHAHFDKGGTFDQIQTN